MLREIYERDLEGADPAIVSACRTNHGPQQPGEGTWALSRGFLAARSRRVAASNCLVDDEAGARLVGAFCARLAEAEKDGKAPDHAALLRDAKRWVKGRSRWRSPYFWAGLVPVGPR
jgi:CHAT domain-containing protein